MANNTKVRLKREKIFGDLQKKELFKVIDTSCLTEKTVYLEEKYNTIVLKVRKQYNKQMIRLATEAVFTGVKVIDVRVLNYKSINKKFRGYAYRSQTHKKAYIRLCKDSEIELGDNQKAITKFTKVHTETKEVNK